MGSNRGPFCLIPKRRRLQGEGRHDKVPVPHPSALNEAMTDEQPLRSPLPWAALSWIGAVGSLAVITVLVLYIWGNDSNHTGFEPWLLSSFFVPTAIVGMVAWRRGRSRWGALAAVLIGLGGMALLFYLDHFNVMVEYERLGKRGGL